MHAETIDPRDVFLRLYTEAIAANEDDGLVDTRRRQAEHHGATDEDIARACAAGIDLLEARRRFPSLATTTVELTN